MSFAMNALIFGITAILLFNLFYLNRKTKEQGAVKKAFRYFTVQSNAFCGLAAFCMCLFPNARWAWLLKYMATAAISLTLLTVLFYLAPALGSLSKLLKRENLFMHLITPLLAILSFCLWEKRGLPGLMFLLGMIPMLLYSVLYLKKVVFSPPQKSWDDLYQFNRKGRWPYALALMLSAQFLICLILRLIQNI